MAHQPLGYTHTSHATYEEPPLAQIGYHSLISRRGKTRIWISAWGFRRPYTSPIDRRYSRSHAAIMLSNSE
jgi:hypothetical protein